MALVKCPECGRERVSDTAEVCPDCGYGVKAHFERIRAEEELKQREIERQAIERKLQEKRDEQIQKQIDSMPIPTFPTGCLFVTIFCVALGSIWLYIGQTIIGKGIGIFFLAAALGGFFYIKDALEVYNLSKTDMKKAKELAYSKMKMEMAQNAFIKASRGISTFACPNCGSKNTKNISTFNRVASMLAFGIASSKIGKQCECKDCKFKW